MARKRTTSTVSRGEGAPDEIRAVSGFRVRFAGPQSLAALVPFGTVRLRCEDGSCVELWSLHESPNGQDRVNVGLKVELSETAAGKLRDPLPGQPTSEVSPLIYVDPASREDNAYPFMIKGWRAYDAAGQPIGLYDRYFILRGIVSVELLVSDQDALSELLNTLGRRAFDEIDVTPSIPWMQPHIS